MLTLADIRDWLKSIYNDANHYYIGRLENKKEKSIGVYELNRLESTPLICLGGLEYNACNIKEASILIHWNNNANETETKALELYYKFMNARNFQITENILVNYIDLLVPEPIDVGTDNANVYERVIQARFYYEEV